MDIARVFGVRRVVGVDIDSTLIKTAKKDLRLGCDRKRRAGDVTKATAHKRLKGDTYYESRDVLGCGLKDGGQKNPLKNVFFVQVVWNVRHSIN